MILRGVTGHQRYTFRNERDALTAREEGLGRPGATRAALIPITKSQAWWELAQDERFGMVRMGEHKGNRVIEKLTIIPVTKEVVEEPDLVETFRRQVADGLFKIWPEKDLTPGEYAAVREDPTRFMTAVGHEVAEKPVGEVVARRDGYVVIEKKS